MVDAADDSLEQYILNHIDAEPDGLKRLNRLAQTRLLYGRMCSGHLQGRLLKMLTSMIAPKRVLELGTYAGYSALCMAEALPNDGEVHTIEIEDELEDFIREAFANNPAGSKITLHIGDALEIIPTLGAEWDMVFIDANKRNYPEYYQLILPLVKHGGYIIADNTLWDGKITNTATNHDAQTLGVDAFNKIVASDPAVEKVIVPIRDGLTIIRKK